MRIFRTKDPKSLGTVKSRQAEVVRAVNSEKGVLEEHKKATVEVKKTRDNEEALLKKAAEKRKVEEKQLSDVKTKKASEEKKQSALSQKTTELKQSSGKEKQKLADLKNDYDVENKKFKSALEGAKAFLLNITKVAQKTSDEAKAEQKVIREENNRLRNEGSELVRENNSLTGQIGDKKETLVQLGIKEASVNERTDSAGDDFERRKGLVIDLNNQIISLGSQKKELAEDVRKGKQEKIQADSKTKEAQSRLLPLLAREKKILEGEKTLKREFAKVGLEFNL